MILTTLTAAALGSYTLKTALGIARDQDVLDALSRLKDGTAKAAKIVKDGVADAATRVHEHQRVAGYKRQDNLLVARVFENATEQERQTLIEIFEKYASQ